MVCFLLEVLKATCLRTQAQERKGKGKQRRVSFSGMPEELAGLDTEPERFPDGLSGVDVLLDLLGKSLAQRSQGHLEAALHLIEARMMP